MAGRERQIRLGLAVTTAVVGATFGVVALFGVTPAHAELSGLAKDCEGSGPNAVALEGQSVICTVKVGLGAPPGTTFSVTLNEPSGQGWLVTKCVSDNVATVGPAAQAGNTCKWGPTLMALAPQATLGTETFTVGPAAPDGTLVMQNGETCLPVVGCPPPGTPLAMQGPGDSGNGWCVGGGQSNQGGLAIACSPGSGMTTTTTSNTTTSSSETSSNGGNNGNNGNSETGEGGETTSGVQAAATATKFTGGPEHPFPVLATGLILGSLLLALTLGPGPSLVRRLRKERSGK